MERDAKDPTGQTPAKPMSPDEEVVGELTAGLAAELPPEEEQLPPALRARLVAIGESMVREEARARARAEGARVDTRIAVRRADPALRVRTWGGWVAAAAAVVLWIAVPRTSTPVTAPPLSPAAEAAALRAELLAAATPAPALAWTATKDSTAIGATGDVVWSDETQRGVMRFVGLQPNDASRYQYQLWIFDEKRDKAYPVDGGVFDVPAGSTEVLVPIDPRVPVGKAVLFAITVEPPGGVVVSTRERIALVAERKS